VKIAEYSASYPLDRSYRVHERNYGPGIGTKHCFIGMHGYGGRATQYMPALAAQPGYHTPTLVQQGGLVGYGIDHSQINAFGDPGAVWATDDAYTYLNGTFLMPTSKIMIQGWSMGGLTALNWALRNTSKIAGMILWNPLTDLRFTRDAAGSYTPTYSVGGAGATQGLYTAEINTLYAASTTAVGAQTINNNVGAPVTLNVTNAREFSDSLTLGGASVAQATVTGVAFTYTGKTATTLTGCKSTTGSSISVANAAAITSAYATQSQAYNPWAIASAFSTANGFTFPVWVVQSSDDTTVPPAMNSDATNGFVARTGNSNFTLTSPTGGHSGGISNTTKAAVLAFANSLSW
jgi:pimeloyl-ACP methyl ester carboxylesterase